MNLDNKQIYRGIGTALMAAGVALMGYSVYEAIEEERQSRERFEQIENRKEQNSEK
jgi:cbb3-type cytochrome oxidase subunit 1